MFDLQNKVAIVTGVGSKLGIGYATARILAAAGANIVITSTTNRIFERVRELQDNFGEEKIKAMPADLTNVDNVKELISFTLKWFTKVDILVNNAGMVEVTRKVPSMEFKQLTEASWDYGIDINLKTTFLVTRYALPEIQKQEMGRIINISSVTGSLVGIPGSTTYSASKAAMLGLTRSLAIEEARNGITVNCVGPGWIKTGSSSKEEIMAGSLTPVGRSGTPEEVGNVVLFLASKQSSYITGQLIVVDGGNTIQEYKVNFNT